VGKIDPNRLALLVTLIVLAALTVGSGYRLEIGTKGLKLENGLVNSTPMQSSDGKPGFDHHP
jgi:hypothetical protein